MLGPVTSGLLGVKAPAAAGTGVGRLPLTVCIGAIEGAMRWLPLSDVV